jgi:geranylgeranylglycerol-phosphate geranylgeranyltransferase
MVALIAIIGQVLASAEAPKLVSLIPTFLTGFFMTASSFTINDYVDHEIDAINAPWRPIPSGRLTKKEALRFGVALGIMGFAVSIFTSMAASVVAIGSFFMSVLYTVKGKYLGLLGHAMVALSIASTFIFGALTVLEGVTPQLSGIFIVSFLYILGGELTQSISDYEGDKAMGVRSMAIIQGPRSAAITATICYILMALSGAVTSTLSGAGLDPYSLIITIGTLIAVSCITLPLLKTPNKVTAKMIRRRINNLAYLIIAVLLIASLISYW